MIDYDSLPTREPMRPPQPRGNGNAHDSKQTKRKRCERRSARRARGKNTFGLVHHKR